MCSVASDQDGITRFTTAPCAELQIVDGGQHSPAASSPDTAPEYGDPGIHQEVELTSARSVRLPDGLDVRVLVPEPQPIGLGPPDVMVVDAPRKADPPVHLDRRLRRTALGATRGV